LLPVLRTFPSAIQSSRFFWMTVALYWGFCSFKSRVVNGLPGIWMRIRLRPMRRFSRRRPGGLARCRRSIAWVIERVHPTIFEVGKVLVREQVRPDEGKYSENEQRGAPADEGEAQMVGFKAHGEDRVGSMRRF